ncbi:MAG: hypothetical protein H6Q04_2368 [Acidobacteria bacterium]|nr:hypothetical protein [Acidobacteriota bacterium]
MVSWERPGLEKRYILLSDRCWRTTVSSYLSPIAAATHWRKPDIESIPGSERIPTMATLPSRSIKQPNRLPAFHAHSLMDMNPIPCIFPLASLLVPGGCHFRSQSMAFLPLSMTSFRLPPLGEGIVFLVLGDPIPVVSAAAIVLQRHLGWIEAELSGYPVKHNLKGDAC